MKNIVILILLLATSISYSSAQDLLYSKTGEVLRVKILEVGETQIRFLKFNDQQGTTYNAQVSKVEKIVFENGHVEKFLDKTQRERPEPNIATRSPREIREENIRRLSGKQFTISAAFFGQGGMFSGNFQYKLIKKTKWVHPYIKGGLGFTNKKLYLPHSVTLGVGNLRHQFEFGVGGIYVASLSSANDILQFWYGNEPKYIVHPIYGYRYVNPAGFYFSFQVIPIISRDKYNIDFPDGGGPRRWGITPMPGLSAGFSF